MASPRRTVLLAAFAAVLLVVNIVVLLQQDDSTGPGDQPSPTTTPTAGPGDGTDDDDDDENDREPDGDDGPGGDDTETGDDDGEAGDGADGDRDDGGEPDGNRDGIGGGADVGDTGGTGAGHPDGGAPDDDVVLPDRADYLYASSGTWSLVGAGQDLTYHLPTVATVVVEDGAAGVWTVRRAAGEAYVDEFDHRMGAEGGIDWIGWVVERPGPADALVTTATCTSSSPFYRPGVPARVVEHVCVAGDVVSTATAEQRGSEDVTLGDGTVVRADRLRYDAVVTGPATTGTIELDLWLDPATGLSVREERSIATTTSTADGPLEQREDVTFLLWSREDA